MNNLKISEDSLPIKSINYKKEITFNGNSYKILNKKRSRFISKYQKIEEKNDIYFYHTLNPINIIKNPNMKFKIKKEDLNKLFNELKEKRDFSEIYNTDLFKLSNLYHLIKEKNYIDKKYFSQEISENLKEEKQALIERDNNKYKNKYYDKNKKILFELPGKEHELNRINNFVLIQESINQNKFIVRLKNINDDFNEILLLKPYFDFNELKALIRFLYKTKYDQNNIKIINLYEQEDYKIEINIEETKTLNDLSDKINSKFELTIYIDAQY